MKKANEVSSKEIGETVPYRRPVIRKVVLENKKSMLDTCKYDKHDGSRGLGPCGNDAGSLCKY